MNTWVGKLLVFGAVVLLCADSVKASSLPPDDWRSPVSALLLEPDELTPGWQTAFNFPEGWPSDPTVNHVGRELWSPDKGSAYIIHSVWRAFNSLDAAAKYSHLRREGVLSPSYQPSDWAIYVEFSPPGNEALGMRSADDWYAACGWSIWAFCVVIARYRNYVTYLELPLEADHGDEVSEGLSLLEMDRTLDALDSKFARLVHYPVR
jgi:hypothetical protein